VQENGKVFVKIAVNKKYVLRDNYTYTIRSGLLLGKSAVAIHTAPKPGRVIPPGAVIEGTSPARPEDIIADVRSALQDVSKSLEEARKLIGDPATHAAIRTTFTNLSTASQNVVDLSAVLVASSARAAVQTEGILKGLNTTAGNLANASASVNAFVSDPTLAKNILEMAQSLQKASENIEKLTSKPDLAQAVDNLAAISNDLKKTSAAVSELLISGGALDRVSNTLASAEQAAERLNLAAHAAETVATSPEATTGVKETLSNARIASENALVATEKVNALLSAGEKVIRPASTLNAAGSSELYFLSGADRMESDLELRLGSPWFSRWLVLGAQDVGEATKIDAKVGFSKGKDSRLLGGIHRSKLGVGWEQDWGERLGLALNLYDPNRLQLDLWATYRISPGIHLGMGGLGLGEENYFRYGIGVRK
jgi:ABC-type transporter Mla subunit MlaD